MASRRVTVLHVTNGLGNGGAEGVLTRLCIEDSVNSHFVISLTGGGKYVNVLRDKGIEVEALDIQGVWTAVRGFGRLIRAARRLRPDIIQSWMPHSDLVASILRFIQPSSRLIWSIRHGSWDKDTSKITTRAIVRSLALLSSLSPSKIVSCSKAGVETHVSMGYRPEKFTVIANGIDLEVFSPAQRNINRNRKSFAMLGRFHPQKDHRNLLIALGILAKADVKPKVEIAGIEPLSARLGLEELCKEHLLSDTVVIQGEVANPVEFLKDKDFLISSSSSGEGFPNVVAEAMATGLPSISTDVGDARLIIGNTGWVVPPRDPAALASAIRQACEMSIIDKAKLAKSARQRIQNNFSLEKMVQSYQNLYRDLLEMSTKPTGQRYAFSEDSSDN